MVVVREWPCGKPAQAFSAAQNTQFTFYIAFHETEVVDGQPILESLVQFLQFTGGAVKILASEGFPD